MPTVYQFCYTISMHKITDPTVWTNFFLIIPFVLAMVFGAYLYAMLVAILCIASFSFHITRTNFWFVIDVVFAAIFGIVTIFTFFSSDSEFSLIGIFVGLIGLWIYRLSVTAREHKNLEAYEMYHSWWHVYGSVMACVAVLTFF